VKIGLIDFPRSVGSVGNVFIVFHALHGPAFPRSVRPPHCSCCGQRTLNVDPPSAFELHRPEIIQRRLGVAAHPIERNCLSHPAQPDQHPLASLCLGIIKHAFVDGLPDLNFTRFSDRHHASEGLGALQYASPSRQAATQSNGTAREEPG
jgi:hypothetical protein